MDAAVKEILKLQKQFQPILELANNFPISNDVLKQIDYINSIIPQNIQELSKLINSFQLPEKIKQSHTLEKLLEQNMELNEMYNEISYEEIDQAQKELQEECLDSEEKQSAYTFLEQLK
ncbi:hypothetical protein D3M79_10370, partial [Rodentibacter pneumotropicus]|uniref:hypothetical protein n=1 Tax=Rodentibacter pneumotropicus TaxID=758 RepID=UPI00109C7392